jgi:hypothetical protein
LANGCDGSGIIPRQDVRNSCRERISLHAQFSLDTKLASYGFFAGDVFATFPAFTFRNLVIVFIKMIGVKKISCYSFRDRYNRIEL